jgi:hypothetical protein
VHVVLDGADAEMQRLRDLEVADAEGRGAAALHLTVRECDGLTVLHVPETLREEIHEPRRRVDRLTLGQ